MTDVNEQGNIEGNTHWDCNLDPLHRIAQETIELEKDAKILLEGDTQGCVRQVHVSANGGNRIEAALEQFDNDAAHWKAYLSNLKIGESNRIKVTATNDEDIATDEVFERLLEPYIVSSYDELGNLTSRRNALTGAATEYSWDTWGRLVSVSEHSSDGVSPPFHYLQYFQP